MKKNTKKKGFTLIELIAVIAILAILGAVLVPRIAGYQNKANKSNVQTAAKTMVHAIQAFNADATTPVVDGDLVSAAIPRVNTGNGGANSTINTADPLYTKLAGLQIDQLCGVASGNFTYITGNYAAATAAVAATGGVTAGSILN